MGASAVTAVAPPQRATPTRSGRWRTWRWVLLALVVIVAVAAVTAYLTASRPGGRMDAESTSPAGAHALVTLLRDNGVEVVVAKTVADVRRVLEAHRQFYLSMEFATRAAFNEKIKRLFEVLP